VSDLSAAVSEEGQNPEQQEMPFAVVQGAPVLELPKDLYIPPDALEVFLEAFEGPLDLLLYLIKRQNLDVLNIPIATVTHQYMEYVELMQEMQFELAAEYLVMAAMLAEIKSRMLLPRPVDEEGEEEDPRAELVRRLQEYERFKQAAEDLDEIPRMGRDLFPATVEVLDRKASRPVPAVELQEILAAMADVMKRAEMFAHHHIEREPLSVRERMSQVLEKVRSDRFIEFTTLFTLEEGRRGVVVTVIALLELSRQSLIEFIQTGPYSTVHVKALGTSEESEASELEVED
jgi:segregation and condensation protein A